MKQFKWSLVQLLVGLVFFLTIERIDFAEQNAIDIQSFVYVLTVTAVITIVLFPKLATQPIYRLFAFWILLFIFLKLFVFDQRPFLGGVYTYLTLTELGTLILLIYLAHQLALKLIEFEKANRYVSLAGVGEHLLKMEDADSEIRREMMRSRHFHRSLSVLIVKPDGEDLQAATPELVIEMQQKMASLVMAAKLAELIGEHTRVVDTVMEDHENGRFIILCPEVDSQGSLLLMERISRAVRDEAGINVSTGVASFPEEALTFESLVAQADQKLEKGQQAAATEIKIPFKQDVLQVKS